MSSACAYVRNHYGVPAEIGRRVIAYGKPGIILEDRGHYIGVTLDDDKKVRVGNYHPTDGIVYGAMAEKLPKRPRRSNYDKFLNDDCGLYFHEFLGIIKPKFEQRGSWGAGYMYRMYRTTHHLDSLARESVTGEWCHTMKAAKASYKEALKQARKPYRRWSTTEEFHSFRDIYEGL